MSMIEVFSKKLGKKVPMLQTPEGIMIDPDAIDIRNRIKKSDDPAPGGNSWTAGGWSAGTSGVWINGGWAAGGSSGWLADGWNASPSGWTADGWCAGSNGRWMANGDSK